MLIADSWPRGGGGFVAGCLLIVFGPIVVRLWSEFSLVLFLFLNQRIKDGSERIKDGFIYNEQSGIYKNDEEVAPLPKED